MSAPKDDDLTPLPPPVRESNLDMARDVPAMTLEAAEQAARDSAARLAGESAPASVASVVVDAAGRPAAVPRSDGDIGASPQPDNDASTDRATAAETAPSTTDDDAASPASPTDRGTAAEGRRATPSTTGGPSLADGYSVEPARGEAPGYYSPAARGLVWGMLMLVVGAFVAVGTVFGTRNTSIIITFGFFALAGGGRLAFGATKYPWRDESSDLWLEAGALLRERGALPALAIITLITIYIYSGMFSGELVGDDLSFHMAESRRIADCLAAHDLDLWNPSANGGFASAYYYQVIPQLASALPTAIFGSEHFTFFFQLSVFLPLVAQPACAYRGMRLIGATPWQSLIAAAVVGFMNGESRWGHGNAGTFNVGLYTQTWALSVFPLALGHSVRWLTTGKGLAGATGWSAFVFLCHPFAGIGLGITLAIGLFVSLCTRGLDALFKSIAHGWRTKPSPHDGWFEEFGTAVARRWQNPPKRPPVKAELFRICILGITFVIGCIPLMAPFIVDSAGFGGFPHRVWDEVGPGFTVLGGWWAKGSIMDHNSPIALITWTMPLVLFVARAPWMRWLWWPALAFALALGLGPHLGTTDDDLFPMVRFLGAMQALLALGIGGGACVIGAHIWRAKEGTLTHRAAWFCFGIGLAIATPALGLYTYWAPQGSKILYLFDLVTFSRVESSDTLRLVGAIVFAVGGGVGTILVFGKMRSQYAVRTAYAALGAALATFIMVNGAAALRSRVWTLPQYQDNHRGELMQVARFLETQPQGRKQVGAGAENHWWNLLTYVYGERPALLQMGGGGLQASPNYDFLWNSAHEYVKNAHLYDAPYLVFAKKSADSLPIGETLLSTTNYEVRKLDGSSVVSPIEVIGMLPAGPVTSKSPTRKAALEWLKGDGPVNDKMLAYEDSGPPGPAGDGKVLRAWRQDSPGDDADIVANVQCTTPTTFVARESWHPRWHVYIDGTEATVRRVTPDFPAVDVPPGTHVVAFRFERPWWALACWLLFPGVVLGCWYVQRRKRVKLPQARVVEKKS